MNRTTTYDMKDIGAADMESVIVLKDVCKGRRQHMVGPLNWSLPQGCITALVGENGTGKSTLLHMLLRTLYPDRGEISWFGQTVEGEMPLELRQQIAYVSEKPSREEDRMTARKAAQFRSQWYPGWDQQQFEQMLQAFDVPADALLSKISKGQRQKFELAAAIAAQPRLLLLDEPSSGLDPFAWKDMIVMLNQAMEQGDLTILITTHRMEEVQRLADYVVLMHEGQICGMQEKDELYQQWKEVWINPGQDVQALQWLRECPGIIEWDGKPDGSVRIITSDAQTLQQTAEESGIITQVHGLEWEELLSCWVKDHHLKTGKGAHS
ncbi:ABC transporter ATP-binding protein [Paenibacillus wulumuqiensis]|uniref:ABC transporter ATP-binding protein n=1 Tax=Paenibacillus wulumuqiensis TaxID=1567107 RepID=UPI000B301245|nr:ABC transporter ATP-binding protein [Paenibacillus wulumuqiensis]